MSTTQVTAAQTSSKDEWIETLLGTLSQRQMSLSVEQASMLGEQAWKARHHRDPADVATEIAAPLPGQLPMGLWAELFAIRMEHHGAKQGRMGLIDWAYELYADRQQSTPAAVADEEYETMRASASAKGNPLVF